MKYKAQFVSAKADEYENTETGQVYPYYRVTLKDADQSLVELKCTKEAFDKLEKEEPKMGDEVEVTLGLKKKTSRRIGEAYMEAGIIDW